MMQFRSFTLAEMVIAATINMGAVTAKVYEY